MLMRRRAEEKSVPFIWFSFCHVCEEDFLSWSSDLDVRALTLSGRPVLLADSQLSKTKETPGRGQGAHGTSSGTPAGVDLPRTSGSSRQWATQAREKEPPAHGWLLPPASCPTSSVRPRNPANVVLSSPSVGGSRGPKPDREASLQPLR